ncbi:hypothetical protein RHSIM_Rhsim01G0151200 [Rhododendron simsii]|uniref:Uncharacterized protein n=1 Tax=Rhododendron simsii TaxID=118357 RepID=A0A834HGQ4_RHOSS|nr:hypothetical protein RHSIM_Rhsim01G0151200 [Rhododendron simsii]
MPDTNLEGLLRRTMDYDAYKERYLAMSLGVEQELQRRVTEIEARRIASGVEVGGEQGRGGRSQRGRGRGARAIVDIPRLPRPDMNLPNPISREWAESAIMRMLGLRKLLRDCARRKTLQTRPAPEPAATPVTEPAQVQPEPEEPEELGETEGSEESLGAFDSDIDSGLPDPSDGDNDNDDDDNSKEEDPPQKKSRRG